MKKRIALFWVLVLFLPLFSSAESSHDLAFRQIEVCAFSAEYGGHSGSVVKWTGEIRVFFSGKYETEDLAFFYDFIKRLSENVPGLPPVVLVNSEAESNVTVRFVRLSEMPSAVTNYVEGNWGMFTYWYNSGVIASAEIGIAYDKCDRRARAHLLMEEFIGALGLANDHNLDQNSILYQKWTTVQSLTDADWNMLRMLYDSRVRPDMGREEALRIMRGIY